MPTYHYRCHACEHEFEEFQSMSDDPLIRCPECGKRKLVRVISGAGLVFRGSGFYLTDYKQREHPPGPTGREKSPSSGEGGEAAAESPGDDAKKKAGKVKSDQADSGTGDSRSSGNTRRTKEKPKTPPSGERPSGGKPSGGK